MKIYGLTDRGAVREINEDSIGILSLPSGMTVAVVCDGMGGAAGGRTASELAVETFTESIREELSRTERPDVKSIKRALEISIEAANSAIFEHALIHTELQGMGCTLNAVVCSPELSRLCFANVGDSRLYTITKKEIKQLSKDHSFVQFLVDTGEITPTEAETHPQKNLITRAVGIDPTVEADIAYIKLPQKKQVSFLLCSDGLHGLVSAENIKEIVLGNEALEGKVFSLIKAANDAGGHDNVSAILLQINEKGGEVSAR